MNAGFLVAAAVSAFTFCIHTFLGSRLVARPLLRIPKLHPASRWMNFFTWHMATVLLAFMAGGYGWAAFDPSAREIGAFLTALSAAFAALCLYVSLRGRLPLYRVPALSLFTLILLAGLWGVAG